MKWQYTIIFASLMAGIIFLTILLSSVFLPKYYEYKKIGVIRNTYGELIQTAKGSSVAESVTSLSSAFDDLSMRNNISMVILNDESKIVYSSRIGERDMEMVLLGYILGQSIPYDTVRIIEQNDGYVIRKTIALDNEYIEMYGKLDNGYSFLIRTPLESIEESASYANRFYLLTGLAGILCGAVIIFFVSGRISKPILKLSDISARMVDLDFEARYDGPDNNEIGLLGENINIMSESLEKAISELKTANAELKRDIEKKEKAQEEHSEFISNVSHELKTPISLIQGYAEGLKEGVSDDPESRDYYLDVIIDEAGKMNLLVKQLLNLDQLESGYDKIEMERFDIYEVISDYLHSAKVLSDEAGIRIEFDESSGNYVWGDPYRTETVFTNYFSNAVHYCKETAAGKIIRVSFENRGNILRVSVFNSGDPIPEEQMDRIWDKFYKVDKARTREYGGTGVGLSIVKAVQTSLGMGYGVYNTDDGVVFWFELESK